jgi:hypothetical protein
MENNNPYEPLKKAINESIREGKWRNIFFVLNILKIPPNEIADALTIEGNGGPHASETLATSIMNVFNDNEFFEAFPDLEENKVIRNEFHLARSTILKQVASFLDYFEINYGKIVAHQEKLEYCKNLSNLPNRKPWDKVLREFAHEHFMFCIYQELIDALPIEIKTHLDNHQINDLPGRFAFQGFNLASKTESDQHSSAQAAGHAYEHKIAKLLAQSVPHASIEVTKASGDQGADIIFTTSKHKVIIQVKYYSQPVGNSAVQQVYSAKKYYSGTSAAVISNADYTTSAKDLAEKLNVILMHEDEVYTLFSGAFNSD